MPTNKTYSEEGSALFEFVTFILLGQLLVLGGSLAISSRLVEKVELQILANQTVHELITGGQAQLPTEVSLERSECSEQLICITLFRNTLHVSAVGRK